ncbi:MAG TPA: lanthionine synthetase LanC family protein [Gaiella sp.]|nr:lanthionine synthetase LanC family protein [Gaiella sp.]
MTALHKPETFEPLTETPWSEARAADAIHAIATAAGDAFDERQLWPAGKWESYLTPLPIKSLYVGAAGVLWRTHGTRRSRSCGARREGCSRRQNCTAVRAKRGGPTPGEGARSASSSGTRTAVSGRTCSTASSGTASRRRTASSGTSTRSSTAARCSTRHNEDLLLAGAELVWQAGAHGEEKGPSICHGTAGNGYALLRTFERTGDERWLDRARRFAMHALEQVERRENRYALWTGDVGVAVFASDCLDARPRYPILETRA